MAGGPRTLAELHSSEGLPLGRQGVVYCAHQPQQSAAYTGPEPLEATAQVIRTAKGPSGPNEEILGDGGFLFLLTFERGAALWTLWPGHFSHLLSFSKFCATNPRKSWKGWKTEKRCGSDGKSNVGKHFLSPALNMTTSIVTFLHFVMFIFIQIQFSNFRG